MELLSPAGSFQSLIAAVNSGADAVYLGGAKFGARRSAKNFSLEEIERWVKHCHIFGVKVYVTVNTLIKESEVEELAEYVKSLAEINVDAVLVQDFGVLSIIKKVAPSLELHASTQMTATSLEDVLFLQELGVKRVVLSRELSFDEIKYICENTTCEIEVFVHGAICMCYSGQCLFSSIIGGRSGNRGACAQPCRLPYELVEDEKSVKKGYLLSPKDLCLADYLEDLKKIGVASIKIEGRLKRAEYVSTVVGIYRRLLDANGSKATDIDKKELSDAFGRGFTKGLFGNERGQAMMSFDNPSNKAENIFTEDAKKRCQEDFDGRKIPIYIHGKARLGEKITVSAWDNFGNFAEAISDSVCKRAEKSPTGEERFIKSLSKLGGTPFCIVEATAEIDSEAIVPISEINKLRREAIAGLLEKLCEREKSEVFELTKKEAKIKKNNIEIICSVSTNEQIQAAKNLGIKTIIAPEKLGGTITKASDITKGTKVVGKNILISNIGQITQYSGSTLFGGARLNITNSYSADFYNSFLDFGVLSQELRLEEIRDITSKTELPCALICYGRIELMLCENCPIKAFGKCQKGENKYSLKDRKGESFPLACTPTCQLKILNSKPIFLADKWDKLLNSGIKYAVLSFTTENKKETAEIIEKYIKANNGEKIEPLPENTFTRGHFFRGIE